MVTTNYNNVIVTFRNYIKKFKYTTYLDHFENIEKGIPFHEQKFSGSTSFEQFLHANTIFLGSQWCRVRFGLVKWNGKLVTKLSTNVKWLKCFSKFLGSYEVILLISFCPILLLIFYWCHLSWHQSKEIGVISQN